MTGTPVWRIRVYLGPEHASPWSVFAKLGGRAGGQLFPKHCTIQPEESQSLIYYLGGALAMSAHAIV